MKSELHRPWGQTLQHEKGAVLAYGKRVDQTRRAKDNRVLLLSVIVVAVIRYNIVLTSEEHIWLCKLPFDDPATPPVLHPLRECPQLS